MSSDTRIQILLVEDEAVLALDLCDTLEAEGYAVVGPARNGPRALELFGQHRIDILLCDIHIQGPWDGIETARRLLAERPVPVIYLTAMADKDTLDRALTTTPAAYLTKPATTAGLRAAIEVAFHTFARQVAPAPAAESAPLPDRETLSRESILQLDDHVFIKHNYQFVRVPLADILLLAADNTYTTLVTPTRKYALRLSLGAVLERLHFVQLVRIHRSYAVNIQRVEAFSETEATVAGQAVPLGRQYKEAFLQHFHFR
ncbi:response regulator [Hymenobacter sp. J193]|uniref:response regulator n=1 Tax=Hymenobacter sp. J193 TaxID=2898429 RepID=UPI002150C9B6|nr:response regulator [Hymenobacter sp. J193]MCR5887244.1 response regulator [Hymenobacter sp. J193]